MSGWTEWMGWTGWTWEAKNNPVEPEPLIPKHGGYRKLKRFQIAQLCYDVTVRFLRGLMLRSHGSRQDERARAVLLGEEFQRRADFQPIEAVAEPAVKISCVVGDEYIGPRAGGEEHGAVFGLGENHGAVAAEHIRADVQARTNRAPFVLHRRREFHDVAPDFPQDVGSRNQLPAIRRGLSGGKRCLGN